MEVKETALMYVKKKKGVFVYLQYSFVSLIKRAFYWSRLLEYLDEKSHQGLVSSNPLDQN